MADASPAVHPARPSGLIDFRKHAEYPIILGDSLKDESSQFIDLRFNWQPKSGFKDFSSKLAKTEDGYSLKVDDPATSDPAYRYTGHERHLSSNGDEMSSLALVFDKKRSAFVMERISHSVDLNLASAASQSRDDIRRRAQLPPPSHRGSKQSTTNAAEDDEEPDPSNPFDFRNFLDEAKETVDKALGSRSPLPGARTPMSGFASPAAGPTRFVPTSSQSLTSHRDTAVSRKPKQDTPLRKPKPPQDRHKPIRPPNGALSKERISDSDDELSDVPLAVTKPASSSTSTRPSTIKKKQNDSPPNTAIATKPTHSHSRNISTTSHSPHIVVNDGDLEIDMGSPPREARTKRRIDAEAFRSHTGTPVLGLSPRIRSPPRSHHHHHHDDTHMKDAEDNDDDDDVEALELGSPRSKTTPGQQQQHRDDHHAPTPTNQNNVSEDDDIAELEDLLGGDDDMDTSGGLGLGIVGAQHRQQDDDDSEVSEEE